MHDKHVFGAYNIVVVRLLASERKVPGKPPDKAFERPNSGELMFPMMGPGLV